MNGVEKWLWALGISGVLGYKNAHVLGVFAVFGYPQAQMSDFSELPVFPPALWREKRAHKPI